MGNDPAIGPGFDTCTLTRPTQRRLVTCWMEDAGIHTLMLPQVWRELTSAHPASSQFSAAQAWHRIRKMPDAPFRWVKWTDDLELAAEEIREHFTQACFPGIAADQMHSHGDAAIVSQALAMGTDILVTSDVSTIDHYEINTVAEKALGRNAGFVSTLDDALQSAFPSGEAAERMLIIALATIAPKLDEAWTLDQAYNDLNDLRKAMHGAGLAKTQLRLKTRWEQCRDLESALKEAQGMSDASTALRFERIRTRWHRENHPSSSIAPR